MREIFFTLTVYLHFRLKIYSELFHTTQVYICAKVECVNLNGRDVIQSPDIRITFQNLDLIFASGPSNKKIKFCQKVQV